MVLTDVPPRRAPVGRLVAAYVGAVLIPLQLFALVALSYLMPAVPDRAWNTGQLIAHLTMVGAGLVVLALNVWWFVRAHRAAWSRGPRAQARRAGTAVVIAVYLLWVAVIALVWLVFGYVVVPAGDDGTGVTIQPGLDLGATR